MVYILTETKHRNVWNPIKENIIILKSNRYIEGNSVFSSNNGPPVNVSVFFKDYIIEKKQRVSCSFFSLRKLKEIRNKLFDELLDYVYLLENLEIENDLCHNCIRVIILITKEGE